MSTETTSPTTEPEYTNDVQVSGRVRTDAWTQRTIAGTRVVMVTMFDLAQRIVINPTRSILRIIPCVVYGQLQQASFNEIKAGMDVFVHGELVTSGEMIVKVRVVTYQIRRRPDPEENGRRRASH